MDFITPLLDWLNANPHWAGFATFIISAAESVAIIGTIVPGTITMSAIGALAGAGIIPIWSTLIWAILGAVLGDGISYWMGYYFKDHLKQIWPFKNNPYILTRGEHFVVKYGVMSVFIGRFVGPVRALVPMVAGMLGMKPLHFTIANVTSALGWAPIYLFPGLMVGALAQEFPTDVAMHSLLVLLLIGLFIILCIWVSIKLIFFLRFQIENGLCTIWNSIFKRSRFFGWLLKHHNEQTHPYGQLILAFYWLTTLILFTLLCIYVHTISPNGMSSNVTLYHFFRGMHFPALDSIFLWMTLLGEKEIIVIVTLVMTAWFVYCKQYRTVVLFLVLFAISYLLRTLLKNSLHIPRPDGLLTPLDGFSMPSGHTLFGTSIYLGLAFFIAHALPRKSRFFVYFFAVLMVISIGLSRLYLGAHWFSDVLSGWLAGLSILFFIIILHSRQPTPKVPAFSSILLLLITLSVSIFADYRLRASTFHQQYAMETTPPLFISKKEWIQDTNPYAEMRLLGFSFDYINVKWMGNIKDIQRTLLRQGWEPAPPRNWMSVLYRLTDLNSSEYLPIFSPLYLDQEPAMVFVRYKGVNDNQLLALRLWKSRYIMKEDGSPVWFGHLSVVPRSYAWILGKQKVQINVGVNYIFPKDKKTSQAWHTTVQTISVYPTQYRSILFIEPAS